MKRLIHISLFIGLFFLWAGSAAAHPMGNFSINHYSGLTIGKEAVHIRYILDFAEIPAFQEIQAIDSNADGETTDGEITRYLEIKSGQLAPYLVLKIADEDVPLQVQTHELLFPPGAGGLPTMRLSIDYRAALPTGIDVSNRAYALNYRDENYPQRTGWKEMSAQGMNGIVLIDSTLPTQGSELRAYPDNPLQAPPRVVATGFAFQAGGISIKNLPL